MTGVPIAVLTLTRMGVAVMRMGVAVLVLDCHAPACGACLRTTMTVVRTGLVAKRGRASRQKQEEKRSQRGETKT